MKRFINSIVVTLLMFLGPLMFSAAWVTLIWRCGFINAGLFAGLIWTAAACNHAGPTLAARFISWRISVQQVKGTALKGGGILAVFLLVSVHTVKGTEDVWGRLITQEACHLVARLLNRQAFIEDSPHAFFCREEKQA